MNYPSIFKKKTKNGSWDSVDTPWSRAISQKVGHRGPSLQNSRVLRRLANSLHILDTRTDQGGNQSREGWWVVWLEECRADHVLEICLRCGQEKPQESGRIWEIRTERQLGSVFGHHMPSQAQAFSKFPLPCPQATRPGLDFLSQPLNPFHTSLHVLASLTVPVSLLSLQSTARVHAPC